MAKYKNALYPDKVNDLIDNDGNIKGLPVHWETSARPANEDEEGDENTYLVDCTPEFYQMIWDTVPSIIEAEVELPDEGVQKIVFLFLTKDSEDGVFYAATMSLAGDEMIVLAFANDQAIVMIESEDDEDVYDNWGQSFTTMADFNNSTYDEHRQDKMVSYNITLRYGGDGAWIPGTGTGFPTNMRVRDGNLHIPALFTDLNGNEMPVVFQSNNGYLYFFVTDSQVEVASNSTLYCNITFADVK